MHVRTLYAKADSSCLMNTYDLCSYTLDGFTCFLRPEYRFEGAIFNTNTTLPHRLCEEKATYTVALLSNDGRESHYFRTTKSIHSVVLMKGSKEKKPKQTKRCNVVKVRR